MSTALQAEDFPVRMVGLKSVTVEHEIQSRCETSAGHARSITDFVLKNGPISEPIIVFDDGKKLYVADGFHRVEGYRQAARVNTRFKQIRAEIRPGTKEDAIVYSAGANQKKTYLKRTPEDIKRAVFMLLDLPEWQEKSFAALGKAVGTVATTVRKIRVEYNDSRGVKLPGKLRSSGGHLKNSSCRRTRSSDLPALVKNHRNQFASMIDGKRVYLGSDSPEDASENLKSMVEERESDRKFYEDVTRIVHGLTTLGVHSKSFIKHSSHLPGLFGRRAGNATLTWESFRDKGKAVAAAGRALWLREHTGLARAVVLCPVEDGPAEVLDVFRKLGVEWMTIEDFAASLGAESPVPDPEV